MTKKIIPLIIIAALLFSGIAGKNDAAASSQNPLSTGKIYLQNEMDSIQAMLEGLGTSVGQLPANDKKAYELLNTSLNTKKYLYDIIVCDKDTKVTNVAIKMDAAWIGLNMGKIERYAGLFTSQPVFMIKQHTAADGTPYIYCSVPVKDGGWVIAYVDPYSLEAEFSTLTMGENVNLGVIDTAGTNVYAANMTEIGKNVLTDELYNGFTELQRLIRDKMIPQAKGSGEYTYYASGMGSPVKKSIEWDTIRAFDKELRIYVNTEPAVEDAAVGAPRDFTAEELTWLDSAKATVESEFAVLTGTVNEAVGIYREKGADSPELAQALAKISRESIISKNVYFINTDNYIAQASPEYLAGNNFNLYGVNFLDYSNKKEPFVINLPTGDNHSSALRTMGYVYPVEKDGKLAGWIMSQVRLYDFAAYLTRLQNIGKNVNFMLINTDGNILYDGDITEVGKNCLTDELYTKNMNDFIKNEFMVKKEGHSQYEFYGAGMTAVIPKHIVWKTIPFLGNDFRIAMNSEWVTDQQ